MHHFPGHFPEPWPRTPQIPQRQDKWQGPALLFLLVASALLLLACPARASYVERLASPETSPGAAAAKPATVSRLSQSHLIHLKGPKGTAPRLHSLGSDLPLAHALALLTPRGWLALGAHEAPMTRVSWVAKTPWLATLERIAQETNTLITLDWEEKTFTVQPYSDELYRKLTRSESKNASALAPTPAKPAPAKEPFASAPGTPKSSKAQARMYDRPDLIVSYYAGPGKVYLARDMSVEEASRVLDTKITRLMAWNNLTDKKAVLKKGTLIWLTKPTAPKAPAKSSARPSVKPEKPDANPESKAKAKSTATPEAKTQTAKTSRPASGTDASVTRALATAKSQTKARTVVQTQDKPRANAASTVPAPTPEPAPNPTWSIAPGSLKAQVGSWAARAGYRVVWQADTDLHMAAGATFKGSFAEAVRSLFEGLHEAGAPYTAHIFHGNHVLHIGDR